jgi:tRNA U34 5-carboxymethylaminomethyl modifying GTPase MnmE/TrmE
MSVEDQVGATSQTMQTGEFETERALPAVLEQIALRLGSHAVTKVLVGRVEALRQRLQAGRFHLAVLGQFKRGKSTLLNALLREAFLPTAVVPLTSIPTLLEFGPVRTVQVVFQDGHCESVPPAALSQYVTETHNPHNQKGVARVDVRHPAAILARGVVLIDTPGIGSTFQHNTQATLDFLREVDAALFVNSADPPLTAVELEFLQAVQIRVARIFFLLNKVDYLSPSEQAEAIHFFATTVQTHLHVTGELPIFPVSARLGLEAGERQDANGWAASGMAALERQLLTFLDREKRATLHTAIHSKLAATMHEALDLLQTEQRALTMPLDELRQNHQAFQQALVEARQQRKRMADLLAGDRRRALESLNERAGQLRQQARKHLLAVAVAALDAATNVTSGETVARQQMGQAVDAFFNQHQTTFNQAVDEEVSALLAPYAGQTDRLIQGLHQRAADLFSLQFTMIDPHELPIRQREPYWVRHSRMSGGLAPFTATVERLLPTGQQQRRSVARLQAIAEELATRNVENLRWAVHQNVEQLFLQFQAHLDEQWAETIEATEQALHSAFLRRQQQSDEVAPALAQSQALAAFLREAVIMGRVLSENRLIRKEVRI